MNPPSFIAQCLRLLLCGLIGMLVSQAADRPPQLDLVLQHHCMDCHASEETSGLNLDALSFELSDAGIRGRWINISDRVQAREMPPPDHPITETERQTLLQLLQAPLLAADRAEITATGRVPLRRLNREEYEQNLRDLLQLPELDLRDMLPEDREQDLFNKSADVLEMSRVQLDAFLNAADVALQQAVGTNVPLKSTLYRAIGRDLFAETSTFGEREAMFFAKDNLAVNNNELPALAQDPDLELALFRSAHWPYYGYPRGFVVDQRTFTGKAGDGQAVDLPPETLYRYRVRFSARAVRQLAGYQLIDAEGPVPMTFRARRPSGPDVSGDVRATGGLIDVQPEPHVYETTILLRHGETFEYSLLGLPVPLARNVNGGPPTYRFPPFPDGGQPGIAFQWLEVEGPLASTEEANSTWHVLFGDGLPDDADTMDATRKQATALRLLRRFIQQAAREPVAVETLQRYEQLVLSRLNDGANLQDALLTAYRAFLCSSHFLFLSDPSAPNSDDQMHFAIASRLSHFLTNTRPDAALQELARTGQLRDAAVIQRETSRLIETPGFDRFITSFTDYWLALRHLNRDEPDIRLYPEYRFDAYLLESMQRETQAFFAMMIRENLPVTVLIDADFVLVNDRLAEHYRLAEDDDLPPVIGSALQRIPVPDRSPYGGLLTQAAVLKVTSGSTATSPVVRGAWIMDRLLGQPAPPPPASVPAVVPDIRGAKSIRELLALHTESASCAKCHAKFDPVGLALENYDIFGQWRTRYRGLVAGEAVTGIDRAGHDFEYHLAGAVDASGQLESGEMFADIHELKQILLRNPRQLARNLVLRFIVYSTGAEVRFSDRAEVEAILDRCEMNGYRVRDLLDEVIQSRIFAGGDGCR